MLASMYRPIHVSICKPMITLIARNCLVCNKEFKTKPCLLKIGKGIVCSPLCAYKKLSLDRKGIKPKGFIYSNKIPWNKGLTGLRPSKSAWKPGHVPWNKGLKNAQIAWNKGKEFLAGERNPNYIDGRKLRKYPRSFNEDLKNEIRRRDNFECKNCLMTEEEHLIVNGMRLHVHHIDYTKENIFKENLITLCLSCNVRANYNRDFWMNKYKKLMMYPFIGHS